MSHGALLCLRYMGFKHGHPYWENILPARLRCLAGAKVLLCIERGVALEIYSIHLFWSSPSIHLFWHRTELNRSHKQSYMLRHASFFHSFCGIITKLNIKYRADSRFAPSQWEMVLLCNDVSHWLGASLESTLDAFPTCDKNIIQNNRVELSPARSSPLCKLTH